MLTSLLVLLAALPVCQYTVESPVATMASHGLVVVARAGATADGRTRVSVVRVVKGIVGAEASVPEVWTDPCEGTWRLVPGALYLLTLDAAAGGLAYSDESRAPISRVTAPDAALVGATAIMGTHRRGERDGLDRRWQAAPDSVRSLFVGALYSYGPDPVTGRILRDVMTRYARRPAEARASMAEMALFVSVRNRDAEALPALRLLDTPDGPLRARAAFARATLRDPQLFGDLQARVRSEWPAVDEDDIRAFGELKDARAVPLLVAAVEHEIDAARREQERGGAGFVRNGTVLAFALAGIGAADGVEPVLRLLAATPVGAREYVIEALGAFGAVAAPAAPVLRRIHESAPNAAWARTFRDKAAWALYRIGEAVEAAMPTCAEAAGAPLPLALSMPVVPPPAAPLRGTVALGPPRDLVLPSDFGGPVAVLADLDSDGALDVLVRGGDAGGLGWYRNRGRGAFDPVRVITDTLAAISAAQAVDVDGDGDLDVAAVSSARMLAVWFENVGGRFGPPRGISGPARPDVQHDVWGLDFVHLADLDGDGDADAVMKGAGRLFWTANVDGSGLFGLPRPVGGELSGVDVRPFDADRDGDLDLVYATHSDDYQSSVLVVAPNLDGRGTFGPPVPFGAPSQFAPFEFLAQMATGDLDGDGAPDLAIADGDGTALLALPGDSLRTQPVRAVRGAWSVAVADVDGDGRNDLVFGSRGRGGRAIDVVWLPAQSPDSLRTIAEYPYAPGMDYNPLGRLAVAAGDLDGDGDADVVVAQQGGDRVLWFANDGTGRFAAGGEITRPVGLPSPRPPLAADIDGDGDLDVVVSSWNEGHVAWLETDGDAGAQHDAWTGLGPVALTAAADADGDGDADLVGQQGMRVVWLENDGRGAFALPRPTGPVLVAFGPLAVFDADADGDADMVSAGVRVGQTDLLAADGDSLAVRCPVTRDGSRDVATADLDADGAPDLVTLSTSGAVVWHRNSDGVGGFVAADTVSTDSEAGMTDAVRSLDADGDGDLDLLLQFSVEHDRGSSGELSLFENLDGHGHFGARQRLPETARLEHVHAADLDGDGWTDLIGILPNASLTTFRLVWLRNAGGRFEATRALRSPPLTFNSGLLVRDLDGDGRLDTVVTSAQRNAVWRAPLVHEAE